MVVTNNTILHCVYGAANHGKTTVINAIIDYLILTGGVLKTTLYIHSTDRYCILEHTNKKGHKLTYAIMSGGDTINDLDNQWDTLDTAYSGNIDIIIGASRASKSTPGWWNIKRRRNPFQIQWFPMKDEHPIHHVFYTGAKIAILKAILDV